MERLWTKEERDQRTKKEDGRGETDGSMFFGL